MYMFPFIYTFHLVNNKHQQKSTHTWKIALFLFDHILVGGIINGWSYRCDIITTPKPTRWHHTTGHYYLGGLRILLACPIGGSTARGATRWLPLMAPCPLGSISVKEASWWPLHELFMPSRRQHSNRSHLGCSKETTHVSTVRGATCWVMCELLTSPEPLCCWWLIWPIQNDAKKQLKNDWHPGTRVLIWEHSARIQMNTNMTGFRWFSKTFASLCFGWKWPQHW